jgi:cephalosporin-C deacetylase-like acetyl esterase
MPAMSTKADLMARWPMAKLLEPPSWEALGDGEVGVRPTTYEGEPYRGRASRVFAYLGVPRTVPPAAPGEPAGSGVPGMVLVHGGGGTAFREWVAIWNARGYAAIAMDLAGCGADRQPLPDGGPPQDAPAKFVDPTEAWGDHWVYHSVANVLRAHSLLRSLPGVDATRIGLTGISWGGYLTCVVAALDPRFGCAIPVYGCGFLQDDSAWVDQGIFASMSDTVRQHWHDWCDPSVYVRHATMPLLFVTGTNDNPYPLASHRRTYAVAPQPKALAVRVRMAHGHPQGWAPPEIARFTEHHFRAAPALPQLGDVTREGACAYASLQTSLPVASAQLAYTTDTSRWPDRTWHTAEATINRDTLTATVPSGATAQFFAVTDTAGAYASTPYET